VDERERALRRSALDNCRSARAETAIYHPAGSLSAAERSRGRAAHDCSCDTGGRAHAWVVEDGEDNRRLTCTHFRAAGVRLPGRNDRRPERSPMWVSCRVSG
jgi:hypothetical protein